jgi:hypothetical protein
MQGLNLRLEQRRHCFKLHASSIFYFRNEAPEIAVGAKAKAAPRSDPESHLTPATREATWAGLSAPPVAGIWADQLPVASWSHRLCIQRLLLRLQLQLAAAVAALPAAPASGQIIDPGAPRSTDITRQRA